MSFLDKFCMVGIIVLILATSVFAVSVASPIVMNKFVPRNCVVSNWTDWSMCSIDCGGGVQSRTRTIVLQPQPGGISCPALSEQRVCNLQPCVADCVYSWGEWSSCSAACGGGVQTRDPVIVARESGNGKVCPGSEQRVCNLQPCVADCVYSWGEWSSCSAACGGGVQTRDPVIVARESGNGKVCPGSEQLACNLQPCSEETADRKINTALNRPGAANKADTLNHTAVRMLNKTATRNSTNATEVLIAPVAGSEGLSDDKAPIFENDTIRSESKVPVEGVGHTLKDYLKKLFSFWN